MKKFQVATSHPYDVIIGSDIIKNTGEYVKAISDPCKVCVITDSTVNGIYSQVVMTSLMEAGFQTSKIVFPAGEHSKNMATYVNILEALASEGLSRFDCLVSLGGGVVSDLTGFIASTYMRGIRYIQIPTTLLSAVDASVGGKTSINLMSGKNLAGTFWQPSLVISDYKTFDSLEEEKLRDGFAEAIKSAVIYDKRLISHILKRDYEYIIERCISVKKSLIEVDERDLGLRQLLSFGHTVGHGIEKLTSFAVSHGQAIAKGMIAESRAAYKMGLTKEDISPKIAEVLETFGFDTSLNYPVQDMIKLTSTDKKIKGDKITIIVPETLGKCVLYKLPLSEIGTYITKCLEA